MSMKLTIELISVIGSLLIPMIGFITALVKVIKEKRWNILKSELCKFIIKAEETIEGTGEDKKKAVLEWCEDFCRQQGIKFDANQVSSAIEVLIDLTRRVNAKQSEKSES